MINIQNSYLVPVVGGRNVTVYGDYDDPQKFYIVPLPRFSVDRSTGLPEFSLVSYKISDVEVVGNCRFFVELGVTEDIQNAVKAFLQQLGKPVVVFGQFDWLAVDVYLHYEVSGKAQLAAGVPSLYGDNKTAFSLDLSTKDELVSFENAFQGGALSSFSIEFDVTALAKLPAVDATVTYDAQIAIDYETQYKVEKSSWGQSKRVAIGVKQMLRESNAGSVDLNWGTKDPGPETRQRVTDWAWATLESLVTKAINEAQARSGGTNPVRYAASFTRSYSENQIVEWPFKSAALLAAFDEPTWQKLYKQVDSRQLVVTFGLVGQLINVDSAAPLFDRIDVTVDYPTRVTDNTFTLRPTVAASYTYVAPGKIAQDGSFDPKYSYRYKVFFADDSPPYESDWFPSATTEVQIRPSELGTRQVRFTGSNIPFLPALLDGTPGEGQSAVAEAVTQLLIDLFFDRPVGDNKVEQQVMTMNGAGGERTFQSFYKLPLTTQYSYRLTYQLTSGNLYVIAPQIALESANADNLMLPTPFRNTQRFSLRCRVPATSKEPPPANVYLTVRYVDEVNQVDRENVWDWTPQEKGGFQTAPPWEFLAPYNPDGAMFVLNGQVYYADSMFDINELKYPATQSQLTLEPGIEQYSVRLDGSAIDWSVSSGVEVTLFQYEGTPPPELAGSFMTVEALQLDGKTTNLAPYTLLKPGPVLPELQTRRFYPIERKSSDPNVVFWYNVTYTHRDGTTRYLDDIRVEDQFAVILPPDGTSDRPALVRHELSFAN
jgi:hypothetical protein